MSIDKASPLIAIGSISIRDANTRFVKLLRPVEAAEEAVIAKAGEPCRTPAP